MCLAFSLDVHCFIFLVLEGVQDISGVLAVSISGNPETGITRHQTARSFHNTIVVI